MSEEELSRGYKNPFLLSPKKKKHERITRGEEKYPKDLTPMQKQKRKAARITLIITIVLFSAGGVIYALGVLIPSTICGNDVCEEGETITSCPEDCIKGDQYEKGSLFSDVFTDSETGAQNREALPPLPDTPIDMEYICDNNLDDDGDGFTDCEDDDCNYDDACSSGNPLYIFELNITTPTQISPYFIAPGETIEVKFTFTKDFEPITSGVALIDSRVGNLVCTPISNVFYSEAEGQWTLNCITPDLLMGPQHFFLLVEAVEYEEERADYEFYAVVFPTESQLNGVEMNQPVTKISTSVGAPFNVTCRAQTNDASGINIRYQYRGEGFGIKEIETAGNINLTINPPNPEPNVFDDTPYTHTIIPHSKGIYYIRCRADNGTFSLSTSQIEVNVSEGLNNPPTAVSNLQAASIGDTWLYFTWDAAIDDWGIYRYMLYNDGLYFANRSTALYYNYTGLTLGNTYNFSVQALDTGSVFGPSESVEATTKDITLPSAVSNLNYIGGTDWANFTWDAATDDIAVEKYIISLDSLNIDNTTELYYNITSLTPDTTYNFSVKSMDTAENYGSGTDIEARTLAP